jgi:hypothetical protein
VRLAGRFVAYGAGNAIEPASLRLGRDGTLHWIDGGVTRTGVLR